MTAPLRVYLVDDEPLALKRLGRLLEATGRVQIVGRALDPAHALAEMAEQSLDVVFLDIHMPGLSGLELAKRVSPRTMVVFTTAYEHHAVAAFEVNAVDYLLKPIGRDRLHATLDRLAARRDDPSGRGMRDTLERLARHLRPAAHLDHLASRVGERVQLIQVSDVTHVFARDRATYAATATTEHMLDVTILELERKLDPVRFIRIHRGALVNVAYVGELHAEFGGRLLVRLKDPRRTELVVSRDRVRHLKERLGIV